MTNNQPNQNAKQQPGREHDKSHDQGASNQNKSGQHGGTTTQQSHSGSQIAHSNPSKSKDDEIRRQSAGNSAKGDDSRASRPDQDDDAPSGIADAARKGQSESVTKGEDDLGRGKQGGCGCGDDKPM